MADNCEPVIMVHGGAWAIPDDIAEASTDGVKKAARAGCEVLQQGGSAMDAVVAAVSMMEDDPVFDAGIGSVLNAAGEVEMDAVVMDGKNLKAGAVACVQNVQNPVQLARLVMDKTDHVLLVGKGADQFAAEMGIPVVSPLTLVTDAARTGLSHCGKYREVIEGSFFNRELVDGLPGHDTVGAVALDQQGNVAYATSTGGITAKKPGRVGDSPIIGAGGYADNEVGAVSSTGHGEAILRTCLAQRIMNHMQSGLNPDEASRAALHYMTLRVQGSGGVIVLSPSGDIAANFTTERMAWAGVKNGEVRYGLDAGELHKEPL